MVKDRAKDQGVANMCFLVTEHPIAGHNQEGIRKKMDGEFSAVMQAATKWQPVTK